MNDSSDLITFGRTFLIGLPIGAIALLHAIILDRDGSPRVKRNVNTFMAAVPLTLATLLLLLFVATPIALHIAQLIDRLPFESAPDDPKKGILTGAALLEIKYWGAIASAVYGALGVANILIPVLLKNITHATILGILATVLLAIGAAGGNVFNLLAGENAWQDDRTAIGLIVFVYAGLSIIALLAFTIYLNWSQRRSAA